ncbi:MAG: GNAT family N-acetyltransferase [Planctomycetota bacterium]
MAIEYRELGPNDAALLAAAPDGLFDNAIDAQQAAAFLADEWHHIILAIDDGTSLPVAFVSANGYLHPDKPPQAWINELSTLEAYRGRGIATELVRRMLDVLRARGYREVWLATEHENAAARAVYRRVMAERGGSEDPAVVVYEFPLDDGSG